MTIDIIYFLQNVSLFSQLNKDELIQVSNHIIKNNYIKHEHIFLEGECADAIFIIFYGNVKIYKTSLDGKESIIKFMNKYDVFAEVPVFKGNKYPVSAVATKDSTILSLSRLNLLKLISSNPKIAFDMLALQSSRIKEFSKRIEMLSFKSTSERVLFLLKNSANFSVNIRMQDLANQLCVSRENLSRTLSVLIKKKIIRKNGKILYLAQIKEK